MSTLKNSQLPRRAVAGGALWSVPALVVASAAPAIAASACAAPVIPALTAASWVSADLSPGQHNTQPGTGFTDDGMYWSRDDVLHGQTQSSVETLSSTINVVQGCTYNFSFYGIKIQNNGDNQPDHTNQQVALQINGNTIMQATTGASSGSMMGLLPTSQILTGSYTATTTGSVPITFIFTLLAPTGDNYGNDDIRISDISATVA